MIAEDHRRHQARGARHGGKRPLWAIATKGAATLGRATLGKHLERQWGRSRGEAGKRQEEREKVNGEERGRRERRTEKTGAKRSKSGEPDNMPRLATKRGREKLERRVGVKRRDEKA